MNVPFSHEVTRRVEDWRGKPLIGPRFQSPLVEPDRRISRIRLSDKTSCGRPRTGLGEGPQSHESKPSVKVRVGAACERSTEDLQSALLLESCASGGVRIPAISSGRHGVAETRQSKSRDRPGLARVSARKQT